jgi:thymidylate synthase (FAD)
MTSTKRFVQPLYENSTVPGYVELLDSLGDDGLTCVNAARVSFNKKSESFKDNDLKLLNYLIEHKHTSVLEHNVLTFSFKVPLFVARQHMRHRTWSFNEISRRYTDVGIDFYCPSNFREQSPSNRQASLDSVDFNPELTLVEGTTMNYPKLANQELHEHTIASLILYNKMLQSGICREQARMVLPQNLYTQYWGTVNLNNFFKFLSLRDHEGAQYEIRLMAQACKELAREVWPTLMQIYDEKYGNNHA